MSGRWNSFASHVGHWLLLAYYVYHWFFILGGGALLALPLTPQPLRSLPLLFSVALMAVGSALWLAVDRRRYQSPNPSLRIRTDELIYVVQGNNQYRQRRRVTAKALRHGIDRFRHKFRWSGTGTLKAESHKDGQTAELHSEKSGTITECKIEFPALSKGQSIDLDYSLDLLDKDGTAKPYVAKAIYDWTDRLTLRVQFPEQGFIKAYVRQILSSHVAEMPVWSEEVDPGPECTEISWERKRPRMGYQYHLSWRPK